MLTPKQMIIKGVATYEKKARRLDILETAAVKENGRLSDFGKDFVLLGKKHGMPQCDVARIIDITPAAVNHHYNK